MFNIELVYIMFMVTLSIPQLYSPLRNLNLKATSWITSQILTRQVENLLPTYLFHYHCQRAAALLHYWVTAELNLLSLYLYPTTFNGRAEQSELICN